MLDIVFVIEKFLEKYNINDSKLTYLVAFSGGFDSMCLLHALKSKVKNRIVAIHLNHNWRGAESDNEELNCREFCKQIDVEFYCEKLDSTLPHTETLARDARYKFFDKCCKLFNSNIVFTAHNKNDNAETILYRLCMGTGVSGLQGIQEQRGNFYRPILSVCRDDIKQYCKENHLTPNKDSSNNVDKYKRNNIRLNILPKLKEINPNVINMINSLSEIANDECSIIDEYVDLTLSKIKTDDKIVTSKFFKLSEALQKKIIYKLFLQYDLDYDRTKIERVWKFLYDNKDLKSGTTLSLTKNLWVFINSKIIEVINKPTDLKYNIHVEKEGVYDVGDYVFEIELFNKPVRRFPKDNENIAYVDLSAFDFNFEFRNRLDGDIIKPYGQKGTQKLKKYFNSKKIPNHEKDNVFLFAQDNRILWAVGYGISEDIKVKDKPTHRLKLYKKGE